MKRNYSFIIFIVCSFLLFSCSIKRDNPYDINNPNYVTCTTPTNLNSTALTYNSETLSWSGSSNVAYYNVQYENSLYSSAWTTTTSTTNSITLSNLTTSSYYSFQVQAVCSVNGNSNESAYSDQASFSTSECPTPTNLNAASITSSSAYITWTAVPGFSSYTIQYQDYTDYNTYTVSSSTNSYTLTGLMTGTYYTVQIETNCSAFSNQIYFTTH